MRLKITMTAIREWQEKIAPWLSWDAAEAELRTALEVASIERSVRGAGPETQAEGLPVTWRMRRERVPVTTVRRADVLEIVAVLRPHANWQPRRRAGVAPPTPPRQPVPLVEPDPELPQDAVARLLAELLAQSRGGPRLPTYPELARRTGLSVPEVRRFVEALERVGSLPVEEHSHGRFARGRKARP